MVIDSFKILYPFQSHGMTLDGHRYHYLDEGQGESILMLHGNPSWSFYYRNLISGLKNTYRCIVPDHMGCGFSDKPQHYNYTLSMHIQNLERLMEHLNPGPLNLVVHDWGGAIGMGFAVRHPKLIKRLIILNTAAFIDSRIPLSINLCRVPILGTIFIRWLNGFARGALLRGIKHRERLTPEVKAGYLTPYDSFSNRIAHLKFVQDIPMVPHVPSYSEIQTIEKRLPQFQNLPILIFWGMKDFCFTRHYFKRWKEIFPKAESHKFEDAGHYVLEDAHERILPIFLKFLK